MMDPGPAVNNWTSCLLPSFSNKGGRVEGGGSRKSGEELQTHYFTPPVYCSRIIYNFTPYVVPQHIVQRHNTNKCQH